MSQALAFQPEYGLIGAGAVGASLLGRLPGKADALGPVAASSMRVASRIANTLRAGRAVRSIGELNSVRVILFFAPPDQVESLGSQLIEAGIDWKNKSLVFFDCESFLPDLFRSEGAGVASLRSCPLPGKIIVEGNAPALLHAQRFARQLHMKPIEINAGCSSHFGAALLMGSGALTPLIDMTASLLRDCGLRDSDATEMAAGLFAQTARDYAHSGKQSWEWHIREPELSKLRAWLEASGNARDILARLVLLGTVNFGKHPAAGRLALADIGER